MPKPFIISDDLLEHMASEPAGVEALSLLRKGQQSNHLQLIKYITGADAEDPRRWDPAIQLLSRVQERQRAVFDHLVDYPCVGSWAGYSARRIVGSVSSAVPLHVDVAYLNALAVVAAQRAGLDAELTLYVRDGIVMLPTLGAVRVGAPDLTAVRARVTDGRVRLHDGDGSGAVIELPIDLSQETENWVPVRTVQVEADGLSLELAIEDLDYYRDCYKKPVTGRLSDSDFDRVVALLRPAWEILVRRVPQRAAELTLGLRSIVPLSTDESGPGLSATSGTAFGAFALTRPSRPEHMAATLVHEFQHSKLSALLDLVPLYDKTAQDRYFAAWKPEPRPFGGLLQGSFAFLAVSEFWWHLHQAGDPSAEVQFATLRLQVDDVVRTLEGEPHLNEAGRVFVTQMRRALDDQLAVQVSTEATDHARQTLLDTRNLWEQRRRQAPSH